nr:inactive pancreatic lipase-related protein 1-like isoform X1 [Vanessa tameamea]XP_026494100.1 inactive pancreatic lipase-related protein 1-like isoform X1 [Vanessa tameamea]XP_026494107.1 inactive pancreatic lipase-related protein 1-like isoform X1 [Vanessa tameamea]XP_026494108.1 inactive pancreatic lipase-related protein 1-like isoform X1 [Vanessa tameamea]
MQTTVPLACFLSLIRPPGIQFENALFQIAPVNKGKCPFVRDNIDIVFQLYTRHNPTVAHRLLIDDDESLFASSIDFNDPTVLYFHAFMETPDDGSALRIREAYTHRGDTNIIMVDAQRLEAGPWYFKAAENTWYIGRIAAQFIDYLVSRGLKLSKTHLVGHSLGAQAAGVAGSTIKSGNVSRITGLDPALPLFDKLPLQQRLDPSDAEFVDVIHTDAGIFGFNHQMGHVDFYPNGGISPQPGCELEVVIPQQQLLTKCDDKTHNIRFYVYQLTSQTNSEQLSNTRITTTPTNAIRNSFNSKLEDLNSRQSSFKNPNRLNQKSQETPQNMEPHTYPKTQMPSNVHRAKRFIKKQQTNDNIISKIRRLFSSQTDTPAVTVVREINTFVKSGGGFINHSIREQNSYSENVANTFRPHVYAVQVNSDSKVKAFLKKLFGFGSSTTFVSCK